MGREMASYDYSRAGARIPVRTLGRARGQMSLDLLLAMIIMLVVLYSLIGILHRHEAVQKEISLREQLGENSWATALFIYQSYWYYYFPDTTLNTTTNDFTSFEGTLALNPVRSIDSPQGIDCNVSIHGQDSNSLIFTLFASDTGLPFDVNSLRELRLGFYQTWHDIDVDSCNSVKVTGAP